MPDVFERPRARTQVQDFNDQYDFEIDQNAEKVVLFTDKDCMNQQFDGSKLQVVPEK